MALGSGILTMMSVCLSSVAPASSYAPSYGDRDWNAIVAKSYQSVGSPAPSFNDWLENRWKELCGTSLTRWIEHRRPHLTTANAELGVAREAHGILKRALPNFNLDRGFEFANAARFQERQCLLQSVILAAIFNRLDIKSGITMVWRNSYGVESNLSHAVCLMVLKDGSRSLVDASTSHAFTAPQGIYAALPNGSTRFLEVKQERDGRLKGCRDLDRVPVIPVPLSQAFLRSQFDFYRGERAPGGLHATAPTEAGLRNSAKHLRDALAICPTNPLATVSLSRVQLKLHRLNESRVTLDQALLLYSAGGWVPKGLHQLEADLQSATLRTRRSGYDGS